VIFRFLLALLLAGCAAMPAQQKMDEPEAFQSHLQKIRAINSFAIVGRIAVLTETKGFSGSMRWHHRAEGDDIAFYSPLGTQLGQLTADADGVTLTTGNQHTYHAKDAAELTQQNFGWSLPMAGLPDWVLGRPASGKAEILTWDVAGHITHMKQNGWDIEYPAYQDAAGRQLPAKIVLKSPKLDLKLVVESWQTDAE
jgi:outer membrane lipoprotein LolB